MIDFTGEEHYGFDELVQLVRLLRSENGCPWDRAQTHRSIRRNFLEEAYEACEAIDRDDPKLLCEELGDVLLQVLFHADIESDAGRFTIDDVCDKICKKLIYRHPHVFGAEEHPDWEELKKREKGFATAAQTLDSVARSLPALWRSEKILKKAGRSGVPEESLFDFSDKLEQDACRVRQSADETTVGELLFDTVRAAAASNIDPEQALHDRCEEFISRFAALEQTLSAQGRKISELTREETAAL